MTEKSFSERYFEGLEKIEKALNEAREVMRAADLVKMVFEQQKEIEKLKERIIKIEKVLKNVNENEGRIYQMDKNRKENGD